VPSRAWARSSDLAAHHPTALVGRHAPERGMKTLVADDDEAMRALIEAVLTGAGHDVSTAADGTGAWEICERERPPLVMLDWQMPGLSGIEVCERIRASPFARDIFVVMVTARGASDDLHRLLDAGADDYLSKPLSPEAVQTRVMIAERRILADRARQDAEAALARAQWFAGIGETAVAVQHEINNPLAALLGTVALLDNELTGPGEQQQLIGVITAQATRIAAVVKRLSSLTNPRSVEYIPGSRMLDLSGKEQL
jgi:two-component system, NtrC family, sensor kinase